MKRLLALLLCLMLTLTILPSWAEEDDVPDLSQEEEDEIRAMDDPDEDEDAVVDWVPVGPLYQELELKDFNSNSPALYTAHIIAKLAVYKDKQKTEKLMAVGSAGDTVEVLYVGVDWCIVRCKKGIGYALRRYLTRVTPVNKATTAPYGTQKASYLATTATTTHLRKSMSDEDDSFVVLNKGTLVSIWRVQDGWGIVPYAKNNNRTYAYINMNELEDLIPVSPTDDPISDETPIAAYTSYYNTAQTETNLNRITNIRVACARLTRVMKPHSDLDFNQDVGPYKPSLGYRPAGVLVNGTTSKGYGGGTCQVSSTLYNVLLQLPGIQVMQRRPHGANGAPYLPHGVDAAVGNSSLNLRFRNNYDFSIRVEGHTTDDGALTMVIYKVSGNGK